MAAWIKMPLRMEVMEVGFGPGDFVLDGNPYPSQKGPEPPPKKKILKNRLPWAHPSNNPNGISIGSVIFAQITA